MTIYIAVVMLVIYLLSDKIICNRILDITNHHLKSTERNNESAELILMIRSLSILIVQGFLAVMLASMAFLYYLI